MTSPCKCGAYRFPHRAGGGACRVGIDDVCSECGQPCREKEVDFGIGPYEFWGQRGVDRDIQIASSCCHAPILYASEN